MRATCLRIDLSGEPGPCLYPIVAGAAPSLVHIEPTVIDFLSPAENETIADRSLLPSISVCYRIVVQPAGPNDRRCAAVADGVPRVVSQPVFMPAEAVPVTILTR